MHLLVDTSVLIKWFHREGEGEVLESRALRDAHVRGELAVHMLDLAIYEVGNVLTRALKWDASAVADQIDDLLHIVGFPLAMSECWWREAATLAERHSLSFYDAGWAASAAMLHIPLVSADRRLLAAGLAQTPSAVCAQYGLR